MVPALGLCALGWLWACTGDDDYVPEPDSLSSSSSGGEPTDATVTDATQPVLDDSGSDATTEPVPTDAAAPRAVTGVVLLDSDSVVGQFFAYDDVLFDAEAPHCFGILRGAGRLRAQVGALTVGGEIVGVDGGLEEAVSLAPASGRYLFVGPVFPADQPGHSLSIQVAGNALFPSADVEVKTPSAEVVTLEQPELDGESFAFSSGQALEFVWTPPAVTEDLFLAVQLRQFAHPTQTGIVDLHCNFPLADGRGEVPRSLIDAVAATLGGTAYGEAYIDVAGVGVTRDEEHVYLFVAHAPQSTNWRRVALILSPP